MKFTPNLTRSEQKTGLIVMTLCLFLLPLVLAVTLPQLSAARLNFTSYFICAAAAVYVLRGFLLRNLKTALSRPFLTFYYGCLGYVAQLVLGQLAAVAVYLLAPGFVNLNDTNITTQLHTEFGLLVIVAVVLAPIAEECFFRGLLFRGVYDRSPALAWVLSVGLFAAGHVAGYIGVYTPLELLLAFIQYLPGGIALCIAYQRGGSIFSPILAHSIINLMAVYTVTR